MPGRGGGHGGGQEGFPEGRAMPGLLGSRSRTVWPAASSLCLVSSTARFMAGVGMV